VLKVAYDNLTPARQALLGRIACFRSAVEYDALKALAETEFNAKTQRRKPAWRIRSSPMINAIL